MLNLKGKAGSLHTISGQSEFKNIFTFCTLDITEKISELPELGQAYIYHHPGMVEVNLDILDKWYRKFY